MASNSTVISLAEISQYLWNDTISKESVFFNGTIDPRKAIQLYMERKAFEYGVAQSLENIDGTNNYVYAMCGAKLKQANVILDNGFSGGDVIVGGGGFGVREYSKFPSAGQTSVVFQEAIGATILYASRGSLDVGAFITSGTPIGNQVLWDSATGILTVASTVPFVNDEFVRILVK
jgi:hypothetical protein